VAVSLHNSSIETNNTTQRITMNMKKAVVAIAIVTTLTMSGCATVPTASQEESDKAKTFEVLTDKAGLYIFRDSFVGQALKKTV
jgi:starvation-inducible outer membrane lipoprotein